MTLAKDVLGYTVEERPVALEELKEMDEVLAVGTAVVVTPVGSLTKLALESGEAPTQYQFGASGADASKGVGDIGEVTLRLYEHVRAIQNGEVEDKYGWNFKV
jgi:branched-chain amino acid aminotransferase